jgi:hypothetical protein
LSIGPLLTGRPDWFSAAVFGFFSILLASLDKTNKLSFGYAASTVGV